MLFKNANLFLDGRFRNGSFRVEDGRFVEILTDVPAETASTCRGSLSSPVLSMCTPTAIPVQISRTVTMTVL